MPVYEIEGPDGAVYEVDAPDQRSAIEGLFNSFKPEGANVHETGRGIGSQSEERDVIAERRAPGIAQRLQSLLGMFAPALQGVSLGTGDEVASGIAAMTQPGDFKTNYDINQRAMQMILDKQRKDHPVKSALGELGAGLTTAGVLPVIAPFKGAGALPAVGNAGVSGTVYGGSYGAASAGKGNRLSGGARGAIVGGVTSAALPIIGYSASKAFGPRAVAPDTKKLKEASKSLVRMAEQQGLVVRPDGLNKMLAQTSKDLDLDPVLHRRTLAVLNRLADEGNVPITAERMQAIRQRIADAINDSIEGGSMKPDGAKATILLDRFNKFVDGIKPNDVTVKSGDPKVVAKFLSQHRALWHRFKKAEKLDKLLDLAELTHNSNESTPLPQAIRTQFRGLSRRIIKGQERGFSSGEAAMVRRAAEGTPLSRQMKRLAKFRLNHSGNVVGGGTGMGVGGMAGAGLGYALTGDTTGAIVGAGLGSQVPLLLGGTADDIGEFLMKRYADDAIQHIRGLHDPAIRAMGLLSKSDPGIVGGLLAGTGKAGMNPAIASSIGRGAVPIDQRIFGPRREQRPR